MIDFNSFIEYLGIRKNKKYFIFQDNIISAYEVKNIRKLLKEYSTIEVTNCIEPLKEGQIIYKFFNRVRM